MPERRPPGTQSHDLTARSAAARGRRGLLALLIVGLATTGASSALPPDLVVDPQALMDTLSIQRAYAEAGHCGLGQGCVGGEGFRVFLEFDVVIANLAQQSFDLGSPIGNPLFTRYPCTAFRLLDNFVLYELIGAGGAVLASNLMDPPCLMDSAAYLGDGWVPPSPAHTCGNQGIQQGWAARIPMDEFCQWLDVTDVPPGDYTLRITVDPLNVVAEGIEANNVTTVPVTIPAVMPEPDLIFDLDATGAPPDIVTRFFPPGAPVLQEGCIDATGYRKLVRFDTVTANISQTDFVLGEPETDPRWEFSPSHGHYHFENFGDYRLEDLQGNIVAAGHKQGWYIGSTNQYLFDPWVPTSIIWTMIFGIGRGWADTYSRVVPCQWVDVTDVPNGLYHLVAEVNPVGAFAESNTSNNTFVKFVSITDPKGTPHRPDGDRIAGEPLSVTQAGAGSVTITYDTDFCPPAKFNVYYGLNRPVSDYIYDGAVCDIGGSGTAVIPLPDPAPGSMLWFTIVGAAQTPSTLEGGHGFDSAGVPRPLSGMGFCGITTSEAVTRCPLGPEG